MQDLLKLGHLGDDHIRQSLRPVERRRATNAAIDILEAERVDLSVWPGDLYDGEPSVADEEELDEYLVRLGGISPTVICAGNHDPRGRIKTLARRRTGIDAFSHRFPILATEIPTWWDIAGFRVAALPHVTKAAVAAAMPDLGIAEQDQATLAFVRRTLASCRQDLGAFRGPTVLIGHCDVVGSLASNGESRRDAALALTVEELAGVGASAVALNHIHRQQTLGDGSLWYAGSIYQKDFGERDDEKVVIVATFDVATGRLVERVAHKLPQRHMAKIEAQLTDEGWQTVEKHHPLPGPHVWPELPADTEIWISLSYPADRVAQYHAMRDEAERRYPDARIEGRGVPVIQRRSIDFSSAKGLADAYRAWRRSESDYAPLAPSLELKLEQTEAAVGGFSRAGGPSAMADEGLVLGDLEFSGINSIAGPVRIPYAQMQGIIAFSGPNGSGKTSTFEASLAGLTREMAYYGKSVTARAKGAAHIAQSFRMAGYDYRATLRITASGKMEAALTRDGEPLNDPKKLTEFDDQVADLVGTKDLLELTVFARQADSPEGKQGFFNIAPAERTERIMALTGNERYARAGEYARDQKAVLTVPLAEARSRINSIELRLVALPGLQTQAAGYEISVHDAASALAQADAAVTAAIHAEAEIANLPSNIGGVSREFEEKIARRTELRTKYSELSERLVAEQALAEKRPLVDAAADRLLTLNSEREAATAQLDRVEREVENLQARAQKAAEIATAIATKERARADLFHQAQREAMERMAALVEARNVARAELQAAEQALVIAGSDGDIRAAEARLDAAERALSAAQAKLQEARDRAGLIDRVPFGEKCAEAKCEFVMGAVRDRDTLPALEADVDEKARQVTSAGAAVEAARQAKTETVAAATTLLEVAREEAGLAQRACSEAEQAPVDESPEAMALGGEIAALHEDFAAAEVSPSEIAGARGHLSALREAIVACDAKLAEARDLAAQRPVVEVAERRVAELSAERDRLTVEGVALKEQCDELERRLAGLAEHERLLAEARQAKDEAIAQREAAGDRHAEHRDALASVRGQIAQLDALRPELDAARQDLARLEADHEEWSLIERGCGKHGLQALAVDEAGPEIAELTNQFLWQCHGPRWTFGLATQVEKADGKGVKNRFEPVIFDRGEPRDRVSGGEGAILDVAVRLALAIYNGRHSGRRYQVVWLDEAAQAVGVEHAATYIRMLRLAQELGGIEQILLISHLPAVLGLVDWIVRFKPAATSDGVPPGEIESIECLTSCRSAAPARLAVAI